MFINWRYSLISFTFVTVFNEELFVVCILNYGEYGRKYELECESSLKHEIGILRGFLQWQNLISSGIAERYISALDTFSIALTSLPGFTAVFLQFPFHSWMVLLQLWMYSLFLCLKIVENPWTGVISIAWILCENRNLYLLNKKRKWYAVNDDDHGKKCKVCALKRQEKTP